MENCWSISGTALLLWTWNHPASSGTLLHQTFLAIEPSESISSHCKSIWHFNSNKTMSSWVNHNVFILSTIHSAQSLKVTEIPPTYHTPFIGIVKTILAHAWPCLKNGLISSNNFPVTLRPPAFSRKSRVVQRCANWAQVTGPVPFHHPGVSGIVTRNRRQNYTKIGRYEVYCNQISMLYIYIYHIS